MPAIHSLEDLHVWKVARLLRMSISQMCKTLPACEKWKLIDQMLRASRSVTANIAEGFGRFHYADNARFCCQARGSLVELSEHTICAFDEGYINQAAMEHMQHSINECSKVLNAYIAYLRRASESRQTHKNLITR